MIKFHQTNTPFESSALAYFSCAGNRDGRGVGRIQLDWTGIAQNEVTLFGDELSLRVELQFAIATESMAPVRQLDFEKPRAFNSEVGREAGRTQVALLEIDGSCAGRHDE